MQTELSRGSPLQSEWLTPSFQERHPGARHGKKSGRAHRKPRCRVCGLHLELCICAQLPRVELPLELLLVQHAVEEHRPTNTGRLVHHMFLRSRLIPYGQSDQPLNESLFREPGRRYFILFPRAGGRQLGRGDLVPSDGAPVTLVVPDGNWRQASRMVQRNRVLHEMPCLSLPPGPPGSWTIRNSKHKDRLCTAEAVIRVAEVLGFHEEAERMLAAMMDINEAMLRMRPKHPPA
jgi:DTW domain-containing protein YfiP